MKHWVLFILLNMLVVTSHADEVVLIVNGQNPVEQLSAEDVRDYYFKRRRHWPDGESVRFIDRGSQMPVRDIFLRDILKKSSTDIDLFWIGQKLYTGDSAPLRENSDITVMQFVSSFKGAIGYVSSATVIRSKKIKTVKIVENERD